MCIRDSTCTHRILNSKVIAGVGSALPIRFFDLGTRKNQFPILYNRNKKYEGKLWRRGRCRMKYRRGFSAKSFLTRTWLRYVRPWFEYMLIIIIIIIISEVGRRLSASSQDPRETSFLFQRLSVLIQRYNSVLILESFCSDEDPDL